MAPKNEIQENAPDHQQLTSHQCSSSSASPSCENWCIKLTKVGFPGACSAGLDKQSAKKMELCVDGFTFLQIKE
jgi:hypothetical protein